MYITLMLVLTVGLTAITVMGVRPYDPGEPWWRLFASVLPIALVVAAVLAAVASD
jgi:hypothetical protein